MRIYLIRHGETEWNRQGRLQGHSNVKLSPEGIHQAQLLANHMPIPHVDAIYSSDLARAVATAEILAERFHLAVYKMPELRENYFGNWEGKSMGELATECPDDFGKFFTAPEEFSPPNGENFLHCQARVTNALSRIISRHDNQNVLVVAHGALIRLALCAALDMPIHKMWAIGQFNMAMNILRIDNENVTVELVNSTAHLHNL